MEGDLDANQLLSQLKTQDEWAKAVIFDESANIITHMNCNASQQELKLKKLNQRISESL